MLTWLYHVELLLSIANLSFTIQKLKLLCRKGYYKKDNHIQCIHIFGTAIFARQLTWPTDAMFFYLENITKNLWLFLKEKPSLWDQTVVASSFPIAIFDRVMPQPQIRFDHLPAPKNRLVANGSWTSGVRIPRDYIDPTQQLRGQPILSIARLMYTIYYLVVFLFNMEHTTLVLKR